METNTARYITQAQVPTQNQTTDMKGPNCHTEDGIREVQEDKAFDLLSSLAATAQERGNDGIWTKPLD